MDPRLAVRWCWGSLLAGTGIEIGPGHVPFPVADGVRVRYVDRWRTEENRGLFPELGPGAGFPEPDIKADLDAERLRAVRRRSQDFVIACHILEHLANPIAMLVEIDRVLKPGGRVVIVLPDRTETFDRSRPPTSLEHLLDEFRRDVHEIPHDHVVEAVAAQVRLRGDTRDLDVIGAELGADELAMHRRRSIHAHVWRQDEFEEVLDHARKELGLDWTVIDAMDTGDEGTYGDEFGWLLVKEPASAGTASLRKPFFRRLVRRP
jgi:SAM-dependent methyltransferase